MLTIRMLFLLCCPVDLGKGFCVPFVKSLLPLGLLRTGTEKTAGQGTGPDWAVGFHLFWGGGRNLRESWY